jgi:multiple sugar transport system substrate-binding protein
MKRITVLLVIMIASLIAASCGPAPATAPTEAPEPTKVAETPKPPAEITIVHWQHHHEARAPVVEELAKEFMSENPGVKINFESIPYDAYFDKLITALSTKTGPDVFQVPMEMAEQLINAGAIAPVPESVMTTKQIEDAFLPAAVERFKSGDKYYGLPTDVQTLILFINVDLLKECGGDPAKPPATWEELKAQAQMCTKRDASGAITQAGLDTRYRWAVFTQAMYSFIDGPVVDAANRKAMYDNEQGLAAWKLIAELMTGPNAVDSPEFLTGQRKFEQGKAVFYINHPVTRGRLEREAKNINWIAAPPPVPAGKKPVTPLHVWAYVVNADSKNQEMAWKWVQFLTNKDAQLKWNKAAGDLPSLKELIADPTLAFDANAKVAMDSMTYARPVQQVGQTEVDDIQSKMWERIVINKEPVEIVVKEAAQAETEVIKKILGVK